MHSTHRDVYTQVNVSVCVFFWVVSILDLSRSGEGVNVYSCLFISCLVLLSLFFSPPLSLSKKEKGKAGPRSSALDYPCRITSAMAQSNTYVTGPTATTAMMATTITNRAPSGMWARNICDMCATPGGCGGCCMACCCEPCAFGTINGMLTPGVDQSACAG